MAINRLNVERLNGKVASRPPLKRSNLYSTPPQAAKGIMGKGDCTINHLVGVKDPRVLCGGCRNHSLPSGKSLTSYNFRRHSIAITAFAWFWGAMPHFLPIQDIQVGQSLLS